MVLKNRRRFVNHKKKVMLLSIFFLLLFITVGYAYLSAALSINGSTTIASNTWDIHFANLSVSSGSASAITDATIQSNTTSINYDVELGNLEDFYEFEVDIVNAGTIPAKISLVEITGITEAALPYLETSIKYAGGNPVQVDDLLNPSSRKRIVVRIGYKEELTTLPEDDIELDLTFTINYGQTTELEANAGGLLQNLSSSESCITKYEGQVTDQVGQTVQASNVYYDQCADKRNLIFGGFCWQVIRSTETGGLKMIYNGEPVAGKCESTRGNHMGIIGSKGSSINLNREFLYGNTFIYDNTTQKFTIIDTFLKTWNDSTYESLLGKYTCRTSDDTCETIYLINSYSSVSGGYGASYTMAETNYAQIGTSPFNANYSSPAMAGYMFNKVYNNGSGLTSGSLMGNDVSYENGMYTLLPADGESTLGTTKDNNHHYSCNNTSGTCENVRFYYYNQNFIILIEGENIEEAKNKMLYNDDVNKYNSSVKAIIDIWFEKNLFSKMSMLEDVVYCNSRDMINSTTNAWNKNGKFGSFMDFKNSKSNKNLNCQNITDQFAVSNNLAKLTYPIGLLQFEEISNYTNYSLLTTGVNFWSLSPDAYGQVSTNIRYLTSNNLSGSSSSSSAYGIRPVISLKGENIIFSGTGTESDPWIVN